MKLKNYISVMWRQVLYRLPWLLLIPLGLLIPRFSAKFAVQIEEIYASKVYVVIKNAVSAFTSIMPFSLAEVLLYIIIAAASLGILMMTIRVIVKRTHPAALVKRFVNLGIFAGVLIILFYATWGLNYFREPLKERMSLNVCERPVEELEKLTVRLVRRANALRPNLWEDEDGIAKLRDGYEPVFESLPDAYKTLARTHDEFSGELSHAKPVLWSKGLSWCGITGVYVGFTAEPNVNVDAPEFLLPQTAAHELAHQLGIASEDEAEFAGILACLKSKDPAVVYSGLLAALIECGSALHKQNPDLYWEIYETYGAGVLRDLTFQRAYWAAFEGPTEEIATKTNDSYLKHNSQPSGVQSYSEVVDMLLAYYEQTDFLAP